MANENGCLRDASSGNSASGTRQTLLLAAVAGSDMAWRTILRIYGPLIMFWLRKLQLGGNDIEDVFSNVIDKLFRKLNRFDHNGQKGAFRKWLRKSTERAVLDWQRKERRLPLANSEMVERIAASWESDDVQNEREVGILYRRVWALIRGEFQDKHQEVFRLFVEEGVPADVIAARFNYRPATVYSIVDRIKTRVRELLGE